MSNQPYLPAVREQYEAYPYTLPWILPTSAADCGTPSRVTCC
jgi:hypothetical protein